MPSFPKLPFHGSRPLRAARGVAGVAAAVVLAACWAAAATAAPGHAQRDQELELRGLERAAVVASSRSAITALPRERGGRCADAAILPGQGLACRTEGGLVRLKLPGGRTTTTHGFDPRPLAEAPATDRGSGRLVPPYGSGADIVCGQVTRGRVFLLAHLLPSDHRTVDNTVRRAPSRSVEVRDALRQAAFDSSHHVDERAKELTGDTQRRRMRFQCDPDGQPTVIRVVLPRTSAVYASSTGAVVGGVRTTGFALILHDLTALRVRPEYRVPYGGTTKMPAQRKLIGYYDGQFKPWVGGQGETIPLGQGGLAGTPWAGRTSRGIHNNQPYAMTAVQYGTAYDALGNPDPRGTPDLPSFTTILHEATHTMGAVQDGAPRSSGAGHCTDGLDVMCYLDEPGSRYTETRCPDADAIRTPQDETYDCGGDTYFDPVPSGWLARNWNLGQSMNEFFSRETIANPAPVVPARFAAFASGTRVRLRFEALPPESGLQYEVSKRFRGGAWSRVGAHTGTVLWIDGLKPARDYEFAVAGADRFGNQGVAAQASARTGLDTTRPTRVTRVGAFARQQRAVRIRWNRSRDNVAVRGYRIDRLVGSSWRLTRTMRGAGATPTIGPWITGLSPRTGYRFRIRAFDARGNHSLPVVVRVSTA